jgi:hypothetical protein
MLWSQHDEINHHYRRYNRPMLRDALVQADWQLERLTAFNTLLFPPAAAVRLLQSRRPPAAYRADLDLGPAWLNAVLERPLAWEAGWLARGRSLSVGLSLLAIVTKGSA